MTRWAQRLNFSVQMAPVGKARPRSGQGRTYTPARTQKAERRIAVAARTAMLHQRAPQITGPAFLVCTFCFGLPKSWTKKAKRAASLTFHTGKPDLDNLEKLVNDALNGVVFEDDSAIVAIRAVKMWSDGPAGSVHVTVFEREKE